MVNFNVVERSSADRERELDELYKDFQELWVNTKLNKAEIYRRLDVNHNSHSISHYVNHRLKEDGLPLNRPRCNVQGSRYCREEQYKYVHKTPAGTYCIKKYLNGRTGHFGTYPSLDEAVRARDLFIKNNWRK